jgi:hypothetical protein
MAAMRRHKGQEDGPRISRRRVISLEEASQELMEEQPRTTIRLSAEQATQLGELERHAGGRFRRDAPGDREPRPAARA